MQGTAFTPGTPEREAAFTVMYGTAQCAAARERGGQGFKREKVCVRRRKGTETERKGEREGIMSMSKLAWLTQRKTAVCVTNDLFQ